MYIGSVIYVGIDVHKDTNSVCMYDPADGSFSQSHGSTLEPVTSVSISKSRQKISGLKIKSSL